MKKQRAGDDHKPESISDVIDRMPGGEHLRTIREALAKGQAAVMIGSGFSRNAQGGERLPLWSQLIDSLLADLYSTDAARNRARTSFGGTSGMLRLAEEYAAVRGRAQLETRLHELLPDAGNVTPGEVHTKLLSLSWNDVFTTNYDSLLERAVDEDRGRFNPRIGPRYQVVVAAHDVPFSGRNGRPRIVKLHGSLRTGTRLIVSEEDYRRYPREFGPFVNTVQQSMLENVFCLIGFSGDDPNFLVWTGWARDHLGDKAPPLFFITLSQPSDGQRILLEQRKIFPINIAELGRENGEVNYTKALETLLDYWHEKPPLRRANWPFQNAGVALGTSAQGSLSNLIDWVLVAQRNRREYPGWLVAPVNNRDRVVNQSGFWRGFRLIKQHVTGAPHWLRLLVLDEFCWIFDTALAPLAPEALSFICDELTDPNRLDVPDQVFSLPSTAAVLEPTDSELARIRTRLSLAMLRDARENSNDELFAQWVERMSALPWKALPVEARCEFLHEQILFCLEGRAKDEVFDKLSELAALAAQGVDAYWRIRVGAFFGEVGAVRRGYDIAKSGLHAIRDAIQFSGESAWNLSREQWGEWLLNALDYAVSETEGRGRTARGAHSTLGRHRTTWSPEPGLLARVEQEEGKATEKPKESFTRDENARDNVEHPDFLMDEARRELDIANDAFAVSALGLDATTLLPGAEKSAPFLRDEATEAALTYVRLIERAALPPSVGPVGFTGKTLKSCYQILALTRNPNTHLRILQRTFCGSLSDAADALELPAVALLSKESALRIFSESIEVIESITEDTRWDDRAAITMRRLLDLSSRTAFRLESEHATRLCQLAIRLYSLPAMKEDSSLHRTLSVFFARSLRLLSEAELKRLSPQLLALSSADVRGLERYGWPNIIQYIGRRKGLTRNREWIVVTNAVLDEFEGLSNETHADESSDCLKRLDWIFCAGIMTSDQKRRFSMLVWRGVRRDELPSYRRFYAGAALYWPHPSNHSQVGRTFRRWLETQDFPPIETTSEVLGEMRQVYAHANDDLLVGMLLTASNGVQFGWTELEMICVLDKVRNWWSTEGLRLAEIAAGSSPQRGVDEYLGPRLRLLAHVIHRVASDVLTRETLQACALDVWLEQLWNAGVSMQSPLVPLLFAGLRWWPDRAEAVVELAINVVESNRNPHVTLAALSSASVWLAEMEASTDSTRRFTSYLVDSLRSGPNFLCEQKLDTLIDIVEGAGRVHFQSYVSNLSMTLCTLLRDLQDPGQVAAARFNVYATPILREAVVRLLAAAGQRLNGCDEEHSWKSAVDYARQDALFNVRKHVL